MAASVLGEEETEYESDPEEAKLSLAMRRREASDDEEEDQSEEERRPRRIDSRSVIDSDEESDGQGGAAHYDDEEFYSENGEYYEEKVEVVERVEDVKTYDESEFELVSVVVKHEDDAVRGEDAGEVLFEGNENVVGDGNQAEGDEKKQNEPFSVPTAGAFYMHDDRFRENAGGGRQRPTHVGIKLWESKDVRKWGHDKFEEMSIHERHHEQGRRGSGRGRYQARGRNITSGRGYVRGGRSSAYINGNNQNQAPKSVRGRGPRRYEPSSRNRSDLPPAQNKQQSGRPLEKTSQGSSGRVFTSKSSVDSDPIPQRKGTVASSLSSASPPFYPSGASNKSVTPTPNRNVQPGSTNKNLGSSVIGEGFSIQQSSAPLRGKSIASGAHKHYSDDHNPPTAGRGLGFSGQMHFQPNTLQNQANRSSPSAQLNNLTADQSRTQPASQSMGQRTGNRSQNFSTPGAALSISSFESGGKESAPESSKSNTMMVAKGKGNIHGNGRGPFPYNGAQVMAVAGNMGFGHGDQNFPGASTFLPVMQFGGQHPGGMGVPAVGMAFPGYVGHSEGMRNSEMTWLPVLAGAAGALGATYGSPYMSVDGAYHGRSLEPATSSGSSSKEITDKVSSEEKPLQKIEPAQDELGHRQNKPRRYSEMNFGQ